MTNSDKIITAFRNIFDPQPYYLTVDQALLRVQKGNSKSLVEDIRKQIGKDRADNLKANLPSICFSGKFSKRMDECLLEHSGFIILDFDTIDFLREKQTEIISHDFVYACWISPRANGLKALVKIADGKKHRQHFQALQEIFPELDKSGINESRVCYESYDPDIYFNKNAIAFKKIKEVEKIEIKGNIEDKKEIFDRILKWLSNKGNAFEQGERNIFIFKLSSACCRFGIHQEDCFAFINNNVLPGSTTFSTSECERTIKSAYKSNSAKYATASFEKDILVDNVSRGEIVIDESFCESGRPKDVIFGEDVKAQALALYDKGFEKVEGIGIYDLDHLFKFKRGEISLLSGIGNYGKTTFWFWFILMRVLKFKERFAFFSPENNPAEEFYFDFVEMLLGCDCTPWNTKRPSKIIYESAYDFVSKNIFYVYPKDVAPTPDYIKERFLELIVKEKIDGVVIDPFNQLANDYGKMGRSDKYLETFLSDCIRFAQVNNIYFSIIAHPKLMKKESDGNYPCPDVFDIADGAMWNNKMDNILIYHRPGHQKDPNNPICQFHSKKIRRQKSVGKKGMIDFELFRPQRRYFFNQADYMQKLITERGLDFIPKQTDLDFGSGDQRAWKPFKEN